MYGDVTMLLHTKTWASTWNFGIIANAQKPPWNTHTYVTSWVRYLTFNLGLHLHPYFVYACSEGSGESAHLRRLAWGFVAGQCDKYQHCMCLLNIRFLQLRLCNGIIEILNAWCVSNIFRLNNVEARKPLKQKSYLHCGIALCFTRHAGWLITLIHYSRLFALEVILDLVSHCYGENNSVNV